MTQNIPESDWRVLRSIKTQAIERFCQRITIDIEKINTDPTITFHQKYLAIYSLIHEQDKDLAFIFNDLCRSNANIRLIAMRSHKLPTSPKSVDAQKTWYNEVKDRVNLKLRRLSMASIEIIVRDDQGKIIRQVIDEQVVLPELSLDGVEEAVENWRHTAAKEVSASLLESAQQSFTEAQKVNRT
jgi:hypothetical protein